MEAKILRPLLWFGLLEYRGENTPNTRFVTRNYYRKRYSSARSSLMSKWILRRALTTDAPTIAVPPDSEHLSFPCADTRILILVPYAESSGARTAGLICVDVQRRRSSIQGLFRDHH